MKVIFSTNFRPKTKKIIRAVFEKNITVWFWANLEPFFVNISETRIFFKNPALWHFYLYSPLTSCKKSLKSLEPFLRKLHYQLTNQPIITKNTDFIEPGWRRSKKKQQQHQTSSRCFFVFCLLIFLNKTKLKTCW